MNYLAHLISEDLITIVTDQQTVSVGSSSDMFDTVRDLLGLGQYDDAIREAGSTITRIESVDGSVRVVDGVVHANGEPVDPALNSRIMRMISDGHTVQPMLNFMERLGRNPSMRARQELYRFLSSNNLPITPDGYFLAYKNVRDDYRDKHTGTFDNSVGSVVQMPRSEVMDDPNVTCSTGLHFCSMEYLNGFWGHSGHTMVVQIDPTDVVSIPVDYNNSKGRCCRYTVVAEHMDGHTDTLSNQ